MKKILNIKYAICIAGVLSVLTACNNWLDIQPVAQLNEEQMFSSEDGYQSVLSGVYRNMGEFSLYGKELMWGFNDARAQYYEALNNKYYYTSIKMDYEASEVVSILNGVWSSAYRQIAELNNVLKYIDQADPDDIVHLSLYKGEALALRALLHFDLARLFGPNYLDGKHVVVMPYVTELKNDPAPHLSLDEIYTSVINDLTNAIKELQTVDPVIGFSNEDETYLKNRLNKMNYYAANALLARVYYSMGELEHAMEYATVVMDNRGSEYDFVNPTSVAVAVVKEIVDPITGENTTKTVMEAVADCDRLFETEVLFGLPFPGENLYNTTSITFEGDVSNQGFTRPYADVSRWYEEDSDIRLAAFYERNDSDPNQLNFVRFRKEGDRLYRPAVIRLSELYFIAMEYYIKEDLQQAVEMYNSLREKRGASLWPDDKSIDPESVFDEIVKERRREFPGDGQMGYFYKLHQLPVEVNDYLIYDFEPEKWICPLPLNERIYGNK